MLLAELSCASTYVLVVYVCHGLTDGCKDQTWVAIQKRSETIHHSSIFGWGVGNAIHFLGSGKRIGIALLSPKNHPLLHYQHFLVVVCDS